MLSPFLSPLIAAGASPGVQTTLAIVGAVAEAYAWWRVAERRFRVWYVMPPVFLAMAYFAVLAVPPVWSGNQNAWIAVVIGIASGGVLYLATRAFVWQAVRWQAFDDDVRAQYRLAGSIALPFRLALSTLILVPCEELFWRGLFQSRAESLTGMVIAGAVITWIVFVAVNLPSKSMPMVAGAIVGGAVWAGLFAWSEGILAPMASHMVWTFLMLLLPPLAGRYDDPGRPSTDSSVVLEGKAGSPPEEAEPQQ